MKQSNAFATCRATIVFFKRSLWLVCLLCLHFALPAAAGDPVGSAQTQKVTVPPSSLNSVSMEAFLAGGRDVSYVYTQDQVYLLLRPDVTGEGPVKIMLDLDASLDWNDPATISGVQFDNVPGYDRPEFNCLGHYEFTLTPAQLKNGIMVSFRAWARGYHGEQVTHTPTFTIITSDGAQKKIATPFIVHAIDLNKPRPRAGQASAAFSPPASPPADTTAWRVTRGIMRSEPFSPTTCLDRVALLKTGNQFFAWRIPVMPPTAPGQSFTIPAVHQTAFSPTFTLNVMGQDIVIPLSIQPGASAWANRNLPRGVNEYWVAFGVDPEAVIECPSDYPQQNRYTEITDITFDLSAQAQQGEHAALLSYVCNRSEPGFMEYTCYEPGLTTLVDEANSNWFFEAFATSLALKPGAVMTLNYLLVNTAATPQTFTLTYTSTLPGVADWRAYPPLAGDPGQPDLDHPLGNQVTVAGNSDTSIFYRGTVPAGATSGQYQHALTLSSSTATPASWQALTSLIVMPDGVPPAPLAPTTAVGLAGWGWLAQTDAGQVITYALTAQNTGGLPLPALTLTTTIPAHTTYLSCESNCARAGNVLTWTLPGLEHSAALSAFFTVLVEAGLPAGQRITHADYRVVAGGVSASGQPIHISLPWRRVYLPLVIR